MNETEPQIEGLASGVPSERERTVRAVDLSNRPSLDWLTAVESELNDTDLVLKCLARDSAKICQTCDAAQAAGELQARPMLARCASTKQPR